MTECDFFEYLNWFLFFVFEFNVGVCLGIAYDEEKNS